MLPRGTFESCDAVGASGTFRHVVPFGLLARQAHVLTETMRALVASRFPVHRAQAAPPGRAKFAASRRPRL
jgi:hypothetical protein